LKIYSILEGTRALIKEGNSYRSCYINNRMNFEPSDVVEVNEEIIHFSYRNIDYYIDRINIRILDGRN
jgi:hypothetical protein